MKDDLQAAIYSAFEGAGILARIQPDARVALKPNLTYPFYKPGVTTSPQVLRETVKILRDYTSRVAIVETDGGYGAWRAEEAFAGHGLFDLAKEMSISVINLCKERSESIEVPCGWRSFQLPLPVRLLHETDVFITMPVPKIHCMTGLSLSYKNQWGCIPDIMRLRRHYVFDDAIIAINRALRPAVLADGTFFLDKNGPMDGEPVRMDLIIAASDAGSFDRYVCELMGYPLRRVSHFRRAIRLGDMPATLQEIECNVAPEQYRSRTFQLSRTVRNWLALSGFRSRFVTWFGYESWFGRVVLHAILYAICGKPVKPHPEGEPVQEVV